MTKRKSAGRKAYRTCRRAVCVADARRENNQWRFKAKSEVLSARWHKKRELYHRSKGNVSKGPTTEGI